MIPTKLFLTKGVGVHKDKLVSFELALRDAGIEKCNLVYVSSILPPKCKIITKEEGIKHLSPGQITFCVMAKNESNKPDKLIVSSIGIAVPKDDNSHGYLAEHHASGETAKKAGEYAEYLAETMLATTLGLNGQINKTINISQSAKGNKEKLWTTTIAAAVLLL